MASTNESSQVCELMYLMRDAVERENLEVALYLSRQIHNKLFCMVMDKKTIDCTMKELNNG